MSLIGDGGLKTVAIATERFFSGCLIQRDVGDLRKTQWSVISVRLQLSRASNVIKQKWQVQKKKYVLHLTHTLLVHWHVRYSRNQIQYTIPHICFSQPFSRVNHFRGITYMCLRQLFSRNHIIITVKGAVHFYLCTLNWIYEDMFITNNFVLILYIILLCSRSNVMKLKNSLIWAVDTNKCLASCKNLSVIHLLYSCP